jgi:hypothetical protein
MAEKQAGIIKTAYCEAQQVADAAELILGLDVHKFI